jgi:hypothetical protein
VSDFESILYETITPGEAHILTIGRHVHVKAIKYDTGLTAEQAQAVAARLLECAGVSRLEWLLRCEAAIKSMAAQFLAPKVTPEEMVDQILKGEECDKGRNKSRR